MLACNARSSASNLRVSYALGSGWDWTLKNVLNVIINNEHLECDCLLQECSPTIFSRTRLLQDCSPTIWSRTRSNNILSNLPTARMWLNLFADWGVLQTMNMYMLLPSRWTRLLIIHDSHLAGPDYWHYFANAKRKQLRESPKLLLGSQLLLKGNLGLLGSGLAEDPTRCCIKMPEGLMQTYASTLRVWEAKETSRPTPLVITLAVSANATCEISRPTPLVSTLWPSFCLAIWNFTWTMHS